MKLGAGLILVPLLSFGDTAKVGITTVEITEWTVPWENSRPRDPYVDKHSRVWFVGQKGDYVAYLNPETGQFNRFNLEPGTGPHNLVVDDHGYVWYAGNRKGYIGRLSPPSGKITKYPMPNPAAGDPHTLALDNDGDIWFTVQWGNFVGKLVTATGEIQLIRVPTANARPYGIAVDAQNQPWINEFGTHLIATVDPTTMKLTESQLPNRAARSRRIAVTSDDLIWFVDYARGFLGRLDPETGEIKEWPCPGGPGSRPYAMAADDQDRLWFVETGLQPNRLVGFDSATYEIFSMTEIESGGGSVRNMFFHRRSREIWFGTDTNTIGRAKIP